MITTPLASPNLQLAARQRAMQLRDESFDSLFTSAAATLRRSAQRLAASLRRHERLRSIG
ncbi:hypothetical protein [Ramlibacter albus]|uniref:Uncharacterized protein n=1 Tax=Ramlibacter albus TaxID=2079448 RepID=A0A923M672_9BURK|nr:hypothetical protein [Ramlibacter albus]MBC5764110.1 hypothetical protein [Ramlibacter albus]